MGNEVNRLARIGHSLKKIAYADPDTMRQAFDLVMTLSTVTRPDPATIYGATWTKFTV